ncbi:hypothetical protein HanRHA438_Chr14g0633161 [Helianthus annuus]|nr:hypothetical protein HanRHA438_Chr14g0633161 [Helianthus annuus]
MISSIIWLLYKNSKQSQELFHRMMIMTLGRTCALETKTEDRLS